jgi:hypothetical protein
MTLIGSESAGFRRINHTVAAAVPAIVAGKSGIGVRREFGNLDVVDHVGVSLTL